MHDGRHRHDQNMVGPGEVDDDLEGETSGECERFGPVRRCLIFEIKVTRKKSESNETFAHKIIYIVSKKPLDLESR